MSNTNFEQIIFGKKTFSGLLKDIYDNSRATEQQISELIMDIRPMIQKNPNQAVMLVPLIKEYMEVKVKNDEHLVKMAAVVQRAMTTKGNDGGDFMLSEEEQNQLLEEINKMKPVDVKLLEKPKDTNEA